MKVDKIPLYVWHGWNAKNWFDECHATLIDLFGEKDARLAAQCLAATSMNSYLKGNVTQARKALYQIKNNLPFRGYVPNAVKYLEFARQGKEFPGRKTNNFWKAMVGDKDAVVVDIWIMRAFGYKQLTPSPKQYDLIEGWIRNEAKKRGLEARQLQAMIWIGIRTLQNGPDEENYSTALNRKMKNLFNVI